MDKNKQQQQHESDFWRRRRPADASMNKYRQQQKHESDFRRRRLADESRGTKMRKQKEKPDNDRSCTIFNSTSFGLRNDRSGTISNSKSFSLRKEQQPYRGIGPEPHGEIGGGSRGRKPRPGFDPLTDDNLLYKTSIGSPNLPPRWPVNERKPVNWRLACFMSHEYLTRRTLLGRPWPPQDSNPKCRHENNYKSKAKCGSTDKDEDEIRKEKERLYYTLADFLRAGDVHLPGIVNPSQLASWLELNS